MDFNTTLSEEDRNRLFTKVKHQLGEPIVDVELTEEMMDSYFEIALEEYEQMVYDWMTEQQWGSLFGLDIDTADFTFYLLTKTLDFERSFSYAYSKQIEHGTNSPWELKRDFIVLSADTQRYEIPAGREISNVLWFTQPDVDLGKYLSYNNTLTATGAFGYTIGGQPAHPINHLYNIVSATQDINLRNRINWWDLTYKITGGPNGKKILWLFPVPGGRFDHGHGTSTWYDLFTVGLGHHGLLNTVVWYHYYDAEEERNKCLEENPDAVLLPSDVRFQQLTWSKLNRPSQIWVRKYLLAESKMALAHARGKFSGRIDIPDAEISMDYQMLITQATDEKNKLKEELRRTLENIDWAKLMEKRANIAKYTNDVLGYIPLHIYTG